MRTLLQISAMTLTALCLTGCATKANVQIDPGYDIVRLDEDVKGHVFFQNEAGEWERTRNVVTLPKGWFAGAISKDESKALTTGEESQWPLYGGIAIVILAGILCWRIGRRKKPVDKYNKVDLAS